MDYNEILKEAAGLMGPYCKACPCATAEHAATASPVPAASCPATPPRATTTSGRRSSSIWTRSIPTPTWTRPLSCSAKSSPPPYSSLRSAPLPLHYGDKYDDITYNRVLINSAANYGICAMTGDGEFPQLIPDAVDEMSKIGGIGIPTIKPWNKEVVFEKLDYVKAHNVFAVAMDVDGAGLPFLKKLSPQRRLEER